MKHIILGIMGLLLWTLNATAQIEVTWKLAHNRTVLMEPVRATLRIANHSGRTMDLTPRGNARLLMDVEDKPYSTVKDTGKPLLTDPVIIPDGETREIEVNLLTAYRIVMGQSYMITPVLEFAGMRFFGRRLSLEVQPGLELLQRDCGLPMAGNARAVSLRLIHRERSDHLFFRIDDSARGFCLGVYDLGRVIRFFKPRLELDSNRVFHVLHQTSPDRFAHARFSYDGAPLGTTFYGSSAGSIRLVQNELGEYVVTGGIPYALDENNPGVLIGPELPPAHPYSTNVGEPVAPKAKP